MNIIHSLFRFSEGSSRLNSFVCNLLKMCQTFIFSVFLNSCPKDCILVYPIHYIQKTDSCQLPAWNIFLFLSIYIFSAPCLRLCVPIVFRWSLTFTGCFDPVPWHPSVGGPAVVTNPLLGGSQFRHRSSGLCHIQHDDLCCFSQSVS